MRRVDDLVQTMGLSGISKLQISKLCKGIDPMTEERLALSELLEKGLGPCNEIGDNGAPRSLSGRSATLEPSTMPTSIRFSTFPRTQPPPVFTAAIRDVFQAHTADIGTLNLNKGLTSDQVLAVVRSDLVGLGFTVEAGKTAAGKIKRPVFFGEDGAPQLQYEIDAYHDTWKCGLEIEAGRAWMGNAIYRDLIQALVMVELEALILCIPLGYRYNSGGRTTVSRDYKNAVDVADAIYGHSRINMPYQLVLIGY